MTKTILPILFFDKPQNTLIPLLTNKHLTRNKVPQIETLQHQHPQTTSIDRIIKPPKPPALDPIIKAPNTALTRSSKAPNHRHLTHDVEPPNTALTRSSKAPNHRLLTRSVEPPNPGVDPLNPTPSLGVDPLNLTPSTGVDPLSRTPNHRH